MKILITGAGGQLGKEWVEYLKKQEIDYQAFKSEKLDITHLSQIKEKLENFNPNLVINCAAYTAVDKAEEELERVNSVNAIAPGILAQECAKRNIKLVHYSTDYVFEGDIKDQNIYPNGYPESARTKPINVYGQSKLSGEENIRQSGCEFLILRVSWLSGKYGNNFVKTMLKLAETKGELSIVDDQFGAPTFCKNVVEQTLTLIDLKASGTFHLGSSGITDWKGFADKIFQLSGKKIKTNPISSTAFEARAKRPAFSKLDTTKFEILTHMKSPNWEDGLISLMEEME